jgi:hypothetical protein
MTRDEFLAALRGAGWHLHDQRAHCVEYRSPSERWIEVWDNGDAAFGIHQNRICVATYDRICDRYVDDGAVRRSLLRRIDEAVIAGDEAEMRALLRSYREQLMRGRR